MRRTDQAERSALYEHGLAAKHSTRNRVRKTRLILLSLVLTEIETE